MRAKVKELLQPIVEEVNSRSRIGRDLWFLLTALRGPDDTSDEAKQLKHHTTARLRHALGFNGDAYEFDTNSSPLPKLTDIEREKRDDPNRHFKAHFRLAVEAFEKEDEDE